MDVIELERSAGRATAALLAQISPDDWSSPTPCGDWTVADLVAHLIAGNVKYTEIGGGADWSRGAPEIDVVGDPAEMYAETFDAMLASWRQPGVLEREVSLPQGRGRAEQALYLHLGETLVHGWDVAVAVALEPRFDDAVVEASLAQYASWLPAIRPAGTPFADAAPLGDGAAPIDRLAAYLGREVPAWR